MARAVYQHELGDPDFAWLLAKFQENNPHYKLLDTGVLPLVLLESKKGRLPVADLNPAIIPNKTAGNRIENKRG